MYIKLSCSIVFLLIVGTLCGQKYKPFFDTLQTNIASNLFTDVLLAREYATNYKEEAYELNDTFYMAKGQNFIGMTHYLEGNNITALEYYLASLPLFQSQNDTFFIALLHNNIGAAYGERQEPEKSIQYYEQALEKFLELQDTLWTGNVYNNIGVQYSVLGRYEENLTILRKAKELYKSINDSLSFTYNLVNESSVLCNLKQYDAAEKAGLDYINNYKKFHEPESLANAYKSMAKVNMSRNSISTARKYAQDALDIRIEAKLRNFIDNSYLLLSEIEEKAGDDKKALEYFKLHKIYEDSTWTRDKDKNINELITQYKVKEKDAEINSLNTDREIQALRVKSLKNRQLLYGVGILSLLLLAGGLGYFLYHRNKKNALLKKQNLIIEKNLKEKETLLREIHHRVKNNLQVVSSLLSLQSRSVKDRAAFDALEEGQSRVKSMALIHQHLYKDNQNITSIDMQEYTANLCQSVLSAHKLTENDIVLDLDIEDIQLDINTVVPIGLIMNELITNSCKYGFTEKREGQLLVYLREEGEALVLRIKDNGIGEETGMEGFGSRLIRAFAQKLDAEVIIRQEGGFETELRIKEYEKK